MGTLQSSDEPVADLLAMAAPYNPRKIAPHDLEALRRSLRFFGVVEPVVVNRRSGHIVGGHQRVKAAQAEELESMPVVWVDLDEPAEKQLNLALNRISGSWDDGKLREVLASLEAEGSDLALTGFEDAELERLLQTIQDGFEDPDAVPDTPEVAVTQPGDVWHLGAHRVTCGDSTSADDVARVLGGAAPMLCVTDPPYGVEYDPAWRNEAAAKGQLSYAGRRVGEVHNDDRADWSEAWSLFPGDVVYGWCAPGDLMLEAGAALRKSGFAIRASLIWKKPNFPISRGHYTFQHEPCWYAVRKGGQAHWIGDKSASTVWECSLDKNVPGGHSTQKPVELFRRAIGNHKGDVYEPFLGSGTCLIACEQLGRACYALEVHAPYVDVAVQRWQAFTGKAANLDGHTPFDVVKAARHAA